MDNDPVFIACLSKMLSEWTPQSVKEGSILMDCKHCGKKIWVSEAARKTAEENQHKEVAFVCISCMKQTACKVQAAGQKVHFGGLI